MSLSQNYPFIPVSSGDITLIASELFEMSSAFQTQPSADEKFSHTCFLAIKIMTNQLCFNSRPVLVAASEGGGGFDLTLDLSFPVFSATPKAGTSLPSGWGRGAAALYWTLSHCALQSVRSSFQLSHQTKKKKKSSHCLKKRK